MPNNRIQYTVGIKADASEAQQIVNSLQQQLQKVANMNLHISVPNQELKEASEAARELQTHLKNAINTQTGQLDLSKFNQSLKASGQSLSTLSFNLLKAGSTGTEAFTQMASAIGSAQVPIRTVNKQLAEMATTLKNTVKWQLSSNLVHGLQGGLQSAIGYAKDLNGALNDIRVVTGQSVEQMAKFAQQANTAAKNLSTSTKDYTKAALIYYQQGDDDETVARKTEITTKAANVAFTASTKEMSDMLTAVWNSYQVGTDKLQDVVDVMAALGATTATSMEEISTAMQKVAATANVVGINYDKMSAMIATTSSATRQSAEQIGTSWNTILARFSSLKLGETLEDGVSLSKYTKAIESIGVNVLDVNGELRSMDDIIDDIGAKWQTMNETQKTALAQTVGGVRQYTQLTAFFENFDKYQENLKTAQGSSGALDEQAKIYSESWEAASKRVQASLETIYSQLLNDKAFITILNGVEKIVTGISKVIDAFGGLKGILLTIGTLATNIFEKQIGKTLMDLPNKLKTLTAAGRQQQFAKDQKELSSNILSAQDTDALTKSQNSRLEYTKKIMIMNQQLMAQQDTMSDSQIVKAQTIISNLQMQAEETGKLYSAAEKAEDKIDSLMDEFVEQRSVEVFNEFKAEGEEAQDMVSQVEEKLEQISTVEILDGKEVPIKINFRETIEKAKETQLELERIKNVQNDLKNSISVWKLNKNDEDFSAIDLTNYKTTLQSLEEYAKKAGVSIKENLTEEIEKAANNGDLKTLQGNFRLILADINDGLLKNKYNLMDASNQLQEYIKNIKLPDGKKEQLSALIDEIKEYAKTMADAEKSEEGTNEETDEFSETLREQQDSWGVLASQIASTTMAITRLGTGFADLGKDIANGANASQLISEGMGLLVSAIMAANSLLKINVVQTKLASLATAAHSAATQAAAANSTLLAGALGLVNKVLTASPLFAIVAVLTAVGAAIAAVTAKIEANKKAAEERREQTEKQVKALKEQADAEKQANEELQKNYNTWAELNKSRKDSEEVSQDWVSATEAVLDSLGMEAEKVLLVTGRYNDLATAIERAEEKRIKADIAQANQNYENAKAVGQQYAESYEGAEYYKNPFASSPIETFQIKDLFKDLEYNWDEGFAGIEYQDFINKLVEGLNYEDGLIPKTRGVGSIVLPDASSETLTTLAENYRKLQSSDDYSRIFTAYEKYLSDFSEFIENSGGIILDTKLDAAKLNAIEELKQTVNTSEPINTVGMEQTLTNYLVDQYGYEANSDIVQKIVEDAIKSYLDSLGPKFENALNNFNYRNIAEKTLVGDYKVPQKIFDDAIEEIASQYDPDEVMAHISNYDAIYNAGSTSSSIAAAMIADYVYNTEIAGIQKAFDDIKTGAQALKDQEGKIKSGTKDAEAVTDWFNSLNPEDLGEGWDKERIETMMEMFFNGEETLQEQIINEILDLLTKTTKDRQEKMKEAAEQQFDQMGRVAYANVANIYQRNQNAFGDNIKLYLDSKKMQINDEEFDLTKDEDRVQAIDALTAELKTKKDELDSIRDQLSDKDLSSEERSKLEDKRDELVKYITGAEAAIDAATETENKLANMQQIISGKVVEETEKIAVSAKNAADNFELLSKFVSKSTSVDASNLSKLSEALGKPIEELQNLRDTMTDGQWAIYIQEKAKNAMGSIISKSEANAKIDESDSDNIKTEQDLINQGYAIVSDAKKQEYLQMFEDLKEQATKITYDSIKEILDQKIQDTKTIIAELQNIDLNSLPTDINSQGYKNLAEVFDKTNINYDDFLAETDQTKQTEMLKKAVQGLYDEQIKYYDALIKSKQMQQEATQDTEKQQQLAREITQLEESRKSTAKEGRVKQLEIVANAQQKVIDKAKKMQEMWNGIKLDDIPKAGTKAYNDLSAAMQKVINQINEQDKKQQINTKYSMVDQAIQDQINATEKELEEVNKLKDQAIDETERKEYQDKADEYSETIRQLKESQSTNELERIKSLQTYYETVYDRINKLAQTTKEEIQKDREAIASLLSEDILKSGSLNSTQKNALSDDQVKSWNDAANAQERLVLATEWYKDTLVKEKEALEEIDTVQKNALNRLNDDNFWSQVSLNDFVNTLDQTDYSDELKGYLIKVYKDAIDLGLSGDALTDKMKEIISKSIEGSDEEWEKTYEAMYNSISSVYKQIGEENAAAAEKAAQDWINAFKTIADIRKSLLTDDYDNVGEKIFGSVESVIAAMNAAGGHYESAAQLFEEWKNGKLTADSFRLGNADEYAAALRGGNYDKVINQSGEMRKAYEIYDQILGAGSYGKMAESVGYNQEEIDKNVRMIIEPAIKSMLAASGMTDTEINSTLEQYFAKNIPNATDAATTAIENFAQKLNEASEAMGNYQIVDEIKQEAETAVKDLQSDQSVLNAAQGTLLKDESLTEFGQADELIKILQERGQLGAGAGVSDITSEMLQIALDETAQKIQDLGNSAAIAMGAIESGGANAFTRDENGNFQAIQSMTYAQVEENGITIPQEVIDEYENKVKEEIKARIKNAGIEEGTREWAQKEAEIKQEVENKIAEEVKVDIKSTSTERANKNVVGEELENAGKAVDTQAIQTMENYAKAVGLTNKEFQTYLFSLTKGINSMNDFTKLTAEQQEYLLKVALETKKAANGWEGLQKAQKSTFEVLKKGQTDTYEYLDSLISITNNVKAIFGGAQVVTKEFVEAHLADIEKMANGDMEAAERVEAAVLEAQSILDGWEFNKEIKFDIDKDGIEDDLGTIGEILNNFGDEFSDKEIGFVLTADDEPAIDSLNHLLASGEMTVDQMNAAFEDIGWEPEIEYKEVSVADAQAMGVTGQVVVYIPQPDGTIQQQIGDINGFEDVSADAYIKVPTIKSAKKRGTGVRSMPSTQRPSSRTTRQRASRPTRQPREREEKPKEVREDDAASRESEAKDKADIERYHQVNKQLEQQTMMLERINKLKSARYGGDYLKALRQENEELRRQAKIQEEKYKEAQEYLAFDKKRLEQINQSVVKWWTQDGQKELSSTISGLGLADMQVLYDEEGNIDYQNLMEQATDRYNELREKFMADPEVWGDAFKAYSDWYSNELPQMISKYEESLQNVQQYVNQILDAMNQLSANNVEIIKYKVQLVIEEIEFDKSWEDYVQKAWSDDIEHVADILQSQFNKIFGSKRFDAKGNATGGVLKAINTYLTQLKDANKALKVYQDNKEAIDNFAATGMGADEIAEMLGKEFINEADYATLIKEIRTNLLTELNNLEEYKQALETSYTNLLQLAESEWQKYESIVSNNITIIDTFKEIAKLTGEAYRNDEEYHKWSKEMIDSQIASYDKMIQESMDQYAVHQAQLDELMRKANGDLNNLTEEERKQYDQTLAKAQAAEQKKLEYIQKKLQALRTEYEESIDYILKRLQTAMLQGTGALSFEDLASDYEWYNEQQDRYLSSTKELYEVSKLNRSINQSIEDTTNQATKERLRALQSVIDKQAQLNKLTQYDVDQMNLQYQLALALDQLENARMNKNVVRLTRDEYGNMGYQYTADEDQLNSAQQKYEDVLQQINDLAEKRVQELENSYIQTMNDYYTQARQIAIDYADNEEIRNQKLQELAERTKNRLQFLSEQMNIASANLIQSNTAIFEHYDKQTQKYVGTPEATTGINHTINGLSSQWEKHSILVDQSVNDIVKKMQEYYDKAEETAEKTGTSMAKMAEELEKLTEQNDIAVASIGAVTDALEDQYDQLNEATDAWKDWANAVEDAINDAEKAIKRIGKTLEQMGIDDGSDIWGSRGYGGTGSSTQGGSSGGGNVGGGGANKVDTIKYSLKDLKNDEYDGIPVRGDIKDGEIRYFKKAGDVITFSHMSGSYVWSDDLMGYINIAYLDKEMSDATTYSTTAELLSTAIAQYRIKNRDDLKQYKTGGAVDFTGPAWLDGTPSSPEYILNAQQTDKMFNAIEAVSNLDIDFVRSVFDTINMMTTSALSGFGNLMNPNTFNPISNNDSHNIEQHIEINAQFPDASDYTEIKNVFDTLVNTATQYAYRGQN